MIGHLAPVPPRRRRPRPPRCACRGCRGCSTACRGQPGQARHRRRADRVAARQQRVGKVHPAAVYRHRAVADVRGRHGARPRPADASAMRSARGPICSATRRASTTTSRRPRTCGSWRACTASMRVGSSPRSNASGSTRSRACGRATSPRACASAWPSARCLMRDPDVDTAGRAVRRARRGRSRPRRRPAVGGAAGGRTVVIASHEAAAGRQRRADGCYMEAGRIVAGEPVPRMTPARCGRVAQKDLRVELRSRYALGSVLPFAATMLLAFGFALGPNRLLLQQTAPGLLWLAGCSRPWTCSIAPIGARRERSPRGPAAGPRPQGRGLPGQDDRGAVQVRCWSSATAVMVAVLFGLPSAPLPAAAPADRDPRDRSVSARSEACSGCSPCWAADRRPCPSSCCRWSARWSSARSGRPPRLAQGSTDGVTGWLGVLLAFDAAFLATGYLVYGHLIEDWAELGASGIDSVPAGQTIASKTFLLVCIKNRVTMATSRRSRLRHRGTVAKVRRSVLPRSRRTASGCHRPRASGVARRMVAIDASTATASHDGRAEPSTTPASQVDDAVEEQRRATLMQAREADLPVRHVRRPGVLGRHAAPQPGDRGAPRTAASGRASARRPRSSVGLKVDVERAAGRGARRARRGAGRPRRPGGHAGPAQAQLGGRGEGVLRLRRQPALGGHRVRAVPLDRGRLLRAGHRQAPGRLGQPRPQRRGDRLAVAEPAAGRRPAAHRRADGEDGARRLGAGQVRRRAVPGRQGVPSRRQRPPPR